MFSSWGKWQGQNEEQSCLCKRVLAEGEASFAFTWIKIQGTIWGICYQSLQYVVITGGGFTSTVGWIPAVDIWGVVPEQAAPQVIRWAAGVEKHWEKGTVLSMSEKNLQQGFKGHSS